VLWVLFTAIHRALGLPPGELTDEMLTAAVDAGVTETTDLDWKRELPPQKEVHRTDFPKDVAAMANAGGGMLFFRIEEQNKLAMARTDVGELSEQHERTLRQAAMTALSPPVLNLTIVRLQGTTSSVAVVIPPSLERPHLVYRGEMFGASERVDADTHWMSEQRLEAAYRLRFDGRRNGRQDLDRLFDDEVWGLKRTLVLC
jgi:predicted HTH transcriptional regulator